jgi:hypothetical protein
MSSIFVWLTIGNVVLTELLPVTTVISQSAGPLRHGRIPDMIHGFTELTREF